MIQAYTSIKQMGHSYYVLPDVTSPTFHTFFSFRAVVYSVHLHLGCHTDGHKGVWGDGSSNWRCSTQLTLFCCCACHGHRCFSWHIQRGNVSRVCQIVVVLSRDKMGNSIHWLVAKLICQSSLFEQQLSIVFLRLLHFRKQYNWEHIFRVGEQCSKTSAWCKNN